MTINTAIPTDNLNNTALENISEDQMMAFAESLNALEPSAPSTINTSGLNDILMFDALDVISITCLFAVFAYLSLPLIRNLHKKLFFVSS